MSEQKWVICWLKNADAEIEEEWILEPAPLTESWGFSSEVHGNPLGREGISMQGDWRYKIIAVLNEEVSNFLSSLLTIQDRNETLARGWAAMINLVASLQGYNATGLIGDILEVALNGVEEFGRPPD